MRIPQRAKLARQRANHASLLVLALFHHSRGHEAREYRLGLERYELRVFPDRRDARILDVLPISTRTHVVGRLAGLGAFAALFSLGINLPSAVAYGLVLFVYEAAAGPVRIIAAHLIATAMA